MSPILMLIYRITKCIIKHIKVKSLIEITLPTDGNINTEQSREKIKKKILSPEQMRLTKEIREKCYPAYTEFSRDMVAVYQQAINCIKINEPEAIHPDFIDQESFQIIWLKFLYNLEKNTKIIVLYMKSLPGLSELDIDDLSALFDKHSLFFSIVIKLKI